MTTILTGGCVCGALRYRAEGVPLLQGLCHCRRSRLIRIKAPGTQDLQP
jgi:hypothetical protein